MTNNQGAQQPAPRPATPAPTNHGGMKMGLLGKAVAVAVLLAALTVVVVYGSRGLSGLSANSAIKSKQYQAVFLTNGQVYFGKVAAVDNSYVKLSNIYYLQVQQTVQPEDKSKSSTDTSNQQVSLAKLGGELHGPEDVMYISRAQVLFWENLKSDGKVTKAINDYVAQGKK
jgi:sRNA-binding regulator protein Hfq